MVGHSLVGPPPVRVGARQRRGGARVRPRAPAPVRGGRLARRGRAAHGGRRRRRRAPRAGAVARVSAVVE